VTFWFAGRFSDLRRPLLICAAFFRPARRGSEKGRVFLIRAPFFWSGGRCFEGADGGAEISRRRRGVFWDVGVAAGFGVAGRAGRAEKIGGAG
jgi:hypothetical protein